MKEQTQTDAEQNQALRKEYIDKNQKSWVKIGRDLFTERTLSGIPISEVAGAIGVSDTLLRKLEKGEPVTRAKMVEKAYRMYLELAEAKYKINNLKADKEKLISIEQQLKDIATQALLLENPPETAIQ